MQQRAFAKLRIVDQSCLIDRVVLCSMRGKEVMRHKTHGGHKITQSRFHVEDNIDDTRLDEIDGRR